LALISERASTAVPKLQQSVTRFASRSPDFDPKESILAPYMFIYYRLPNLERTHRHCSAIETELLKQLVDSVQANGGEEFNEAKSYDARSVVSRKTMEYLIRPGNVLVQYSGTSATGFMAASWATESAATASDSSKLALDFDNHIPSEDDAQPGENETQQDELPSENNTAVQRLNQEAYTWKVEAWS